MTIDTKCGGALAFAVLTTIGCGAYDPGVEADSSETLGTETQEIWKASWAPRDRAKSMVGAARAPNKRPYAWFDTGTVCYGAAEMPTADAFCGTEQVFTSPLPARDIRGVAIKQDNSRVVAWYTNVSNPTSGWYSAGTSTNLSSSTGLTVFTPATKPGGGLYNMDLLVDVDHNLADGRYYYYWSSTSCIVTNPNCNLGKIYRTVGSLTRGDAYSAATEVKIPAYDPNAKQLLVGVAAWTYNLGFATIPYFIAYYSDGFVNVSRSSLDFTQP